MNKGLLALVIAAQAVAMCSGLSSPSTRRNALGWIAGACAGCIATPSVNAVDADEFLKTGMVSQPMGVSGQAGKSKPDLGIILRDGSELSRDSRSGAVLAELLLKGEDGKQLMPVLATFSSPWPLATGSVYDVECRDPDTGDGAFLAVSPDVGGKSLGDLKDSFIVKTLFSPTGRFSFYGQPTDIKVKGSALNGDYKVFDVSFSTLSQSTQTEIPRKAKIIATIPKGSTQAVMLVGSASSLRWKKGSEKSISSTVDSFKAIPAPTSMKIRAKETRS